MYDDNRESYIAAYRKEVRDCETVKNSSSISAWSIKHFFTCVTFLRFYCGTKIPHNARHPVNLDSPLQRSSLFILQLQLPTSPSAGEAYINSDPFILRLFSSSSTARLYCLIARIAAEFMSRRRIFRGTPRNGSVVEFHSKVIHVPLAGER